MKPYHWAIFGLTLDIIGAFFLAVEAIKIENLRKLKDKILSPIHNATLSPKIVWVDKDDETIDPTNWNFMIFYNGLHYLAGFLLLFTLNYIFDGWLLKQFWLLTYWVIEQSWYVILMFSLIFLFFGVIAGLWTLGEVIHISITRLTKLSLQLIDFIDLKTPDGTIGIIGFLLLFTGFLFQMLSAYLGSSSSSSSN